MLPLSLPPWLPLRGPHVQVLQPLEFVTGSDSMSESLAATDAPECVLVCVCACAQTPIPLRSRRPSAPSSGTLGRRRPLPCEHAVRAPPSPARLSFGNETRDSAPSGSMAICPKWCVCRLGCGSPSRTLAAPLPPPKVSLSLASGLLHSLALFSECASERSRARVRGNPGQSGGRGEGGKEALRRRLERARRDREGGAGPGPGSGG